MKSKLRMKTTENVNSMSNIESSVTPVIIPHIAWDIFLKDVSDSTRHSPTHSIDNSGQKLSIYAKFLTMLQELRTNKIVNPVDVLRDANQLLDHLTFGFLIKSTNITILHLLELTALEAVSAKMEKGRVVLLTGTLGKWKLATIDLCRAERSNLRWIGKTLLEFFFQLGIGGIFANYDRKIRKDGTLLLEYKS